MKKSPGKIILTYLFIVFNGMLCALSYRLFVFPNKFAPAGIGGVTTMVQYIFDVNIGYLTLLINVPLAIAVYFLISKPLAFRAMVYTVCFSLFSILFRESYLFREVLDLSKLEVKDYILGPLVGGIISGAVNSMLIKVGATQAGVYFISSLIRYKKPHLNLSWLSFALNVVVACISFFVYFKEGRGLMPVLLCILYCFATSLVNDTMTKSGRRAVRFEIVTDDPDALCHAIINEIHHSATILPAKGIYKGKDTNVLICVVNTTQAATLSKIIRRQPNTFAVISQVNEVMGNFKQLDNHNEPQRQLFDAADQKKIY